MKRIKKFQVKRYIWKVTKLDFVHQMSERHCRSERVAKYTVQNYNSIRLWIKCTMYDGQCTSIIIEHLATKCYWTPPKIGLISSCIRCMWPKFCFYFYFYCRYRLFNWCWIMSIQFHLRVCYLFFFFSFFVLSIVFVHFYFVCSLWLNVIIGSGMWNPFEYIMQ